MFGQDMQNPSPRWRFLDACKNGDVDCVKRYVETVSQAGLFQDDAAAQPLGLSQPPGSLAHPPRGRHGPEYPREHVPALHVAAANDNVEAAAILIEHGAKIDTRDT